MDVGRYISIAAAATSVAATDLLILTFIWANNLDSTVLGSIQEVNKEYQNHYKQ